MGVKAYTPAALQCLSSGMVKGVTVWPLNGRERRGFSLRVVLVAFRREWLGAR